MNLPGKQNRMPRAHRPKERLVPYGPWPFLAYCLGATLLVLVPALVIVNVIEWPGQLQGWPVSYRVPHKPGGTLGKTNKGPPVDQRTFAEFYPEGIVANVLLGGIFVVAAVAASARALGLRTRPIQFSLRSLFFVITVVALLITLFPVLHHESQFGAKEEALTAIALVRLGLDLVLLAILFVGVSWLVRRTAERQLESRLLGLHGLTWVIGLLTAVPLFHYSLCVWTGIMPERLGQSNTEWIALDGFGWPMQYFGSRDRPAILIAGRPGPNLDAERFHLAPFLIDVSYSAVATCATFFSVEYWVRRTEQRRPIGARSVTSFILVATITTVICLFDTAYQPPWFDYYSWLFALTCTVHTSVWYLLSVVPGDVWSAADRRMES